MRPRSHGTTAVLRDPLSPGGHRHLELLPTRIKAIRVFDLDHGVLRLAVFASRIHILVLALGAEIHVLAEEALVAYAHNRALADIAGDSRVSHSRTRCCVCVHLLLQGGHFGKKLRLCVYVCQ